MTKLGDLYSDFSRIDLDTRGGYARVAKVKTHTSNLPEYCAFKLMRHELEDPQGGINRFEGELITLLEITAKEDHPSVVTQVFDSGFVSSELSVKLKKPLEQIENTKTIEEINLETEILSTGKNLNSFLATKSTLNKISPDRWLPYLLVEVAPYHDNLLRQIRLLSSGNTSDLYWLSVREIVTMTVQILGAIDHLHKNHNFAYMDWKPEHIYWNSLKSHLKVIDWNVTNRFKNNREKRLFIREDIRMFCGAALYCSLALNDPEDLKRPIGPEPKTPRNPLLSSQSRYWTDKPIFYDRNFMLDDKIKALIQRALDPKKGYDSPQQLRDDLIRYADQALNLSITDLLPSAIAQEKLTEFHKLLAEADDAHSSAEYRRSIQLYSRALRIDPNNEMARARVADAESELLKIEDTGAQLPRESIQLFRRARSYISASDFQDAMRMLDDAIEIAFKKGVIFYEAQQLLDSVKTSVEVNKIQRNINFALTEGDWESALGLYKEAMNLDPNNEVFKREHDELNDLLKTREKLEKRWLDKFFTKLSPLQNLIASTKEFLGSDNSLVKSIERHVYQIKLFRLGIIIMSLLICIAIFPIFGTGIASLFPEKNSSTTTILPSNTPINFMTQSSTPTKAETRATISVTTSPTPSETPTPTQTPPLVTIGTGYISFGLVSSWDKPNGKFVDSLTQYQIVTILEKTNDHGDDWYRCTWEKDGTIKEGWILARYVELGSPPTQKP